MRNNLRKRNKDAVFGQCLGDQLYPWKVCTWCSSMCFSLGSPVADLGPCYLCTRFVVCVGLTHIKEGAVYTGSLQNQCSQQYFWIEWNQIRQPCSRLGRSYFHGFIWQVSPIPQILVVLSVIFFGQDRVLVSDRPVVHSSITTMHNMNPRYQNISPVLKTQEKWRAGTVISES